MDKDDNFNFDKFADSVQVDIATKNAEKAEKKVDKKMKEWDKIREEELAAINLQLRPKKAKLDA